MHAVTIASLAAGKGQRIATMHAIGEDKMHSFCFCENKNKNNWFTFCY